MLFVNLPLTAFANDLVLDKKQETILNYRKFQPKHGDVNLTCENLFVFKKFELKNKSKNAVKILQNEDLYKQQPEQFAKLYFQIPDFEHDLCMGIIFPVFLPVALFDFLEIMLNYSIRPISNLNFAIQNN